MSGAGRWPALSRAAYPLSDTIDYADNGANSRYSAMQVQAQPRFGKGLLSSSTWSWAKYLGDTANGPWGKAGRGISTARVTRLQSGVAGDGANGMRRVRFNLRRHVRTYSTTST